MTRIDDFVKRMARDRRFRGRGKASSYLRFLFEDLAVGDRRVLSIEPEGWFSLYAGCRDAAAVTWLDSSPVKRDHDPQRRFERHRDDLGLQAVVRAMRGAFPGIPSGERFDVILIHESIHRFDERAAPRLSRNLRAIKSYKQSLRQIAQVAEDGAVLIVTGHSPYNLFPFFHLPNPFAPGVDWDAHQSPSLWASLFRQIGFEKPRISWAVPALPGPLGRALFGHVIGSYFYTSHFRLVLTKSTAG